jgi:hypothetical protein
MKLLWVLFGSLASLVLLGVTGLIGDEVKGWVIRLPHALLWVASRRVPASHRRSQYRDWNADLVAFLRDETSERPITRLLQGIAFAASLIRTAPQMAVGPASVDFPDGAKVQPATLDVVPAGAVVVGGRWFEVFDSAHNAAMAYDAFNDVWLLDVRVAANGDKFYTAPKRLPSPWPPNC